jgi:two-component system phosphate regulon sensor histidine kinase PhoR
MFRSRFFWQLCAGFLALTIFTTGVVARLVLRRYDQGAVAAAHQALAAQARMVMAGLSDPVPLNSPQLNERLRRLGRLLGTRFTIIDADGNVLADSHIEAAQLSTHGSLPEVRLARRHGLGRATRPIPTGGRELFTAVAVPESYGWDGFIRASRPLQQTDALRKALRLRMWVAVGLGAVVAVLLAVLFSRRIMLPLRELAEQAEASSDGAASVRVPVYRRDEFGTLARSIDRMSRRLRERMQTIATDRNKLLAILRGMEEGVVAVDQEERVVHMNSVAAGILKANSRTSVNRRIWEATRLREVCEILTRARVSGDEARSTMRLTARPHDRVVELHAAPLRGTEGEPVGAVLVMHDVSALRRLEQVRQDFVANVSHELKTPITAVRGIVETLMDDADMPVSMRTRFLGRVRDQAERLSALVQDLLSLGRLEMPNGGLDARLIDLRDVVQVAQKGLSDAVEERSVRLSANLPSEPIHVRGDDEALRQMIGNLLDNALKYTPEGGAIRLSLEQEDGHAELQVADTGIGIEPRHLDRIFERFYRVDKARSRALGGTGLGLSIVKHVCRAHGGEVSVASVVGQGTTFSVRLPLAPETV